MSSSDLRDVLNIQGGGGGGRPNKKQKLSAPRPNLKGLAREVQSLGGDNPIAIVPEVSNFKKRRLASRKPATRWDLTAFRNSARDDASLVLRHWKRRSDKGQRQPPGDEKEQSQPQQPADQTQEDGSAEVKSEEQRQQSEAAAPSDEIEDSAFAKFNVQVSIPQYTDDQYRQNLTSDQWTKEETDYLMGLAGDFDLRWPLIWDRYEWSPPATNGETNDDGDESKAVVPKTQERTMEDLKARYYEVAAKMMAVQKPVQFMTQPEFALHEMMAHFDPKQEKGRKDFALNALARSKEEADEEASLLLEIKRILARSERFNEERRELYNRLDYPHAETDISNFKSSAGLQNLITTLMTADKSKKRKSLMGPEAAAAAQANPAAATAAQAQAQEANRRDSTATSTAAPTPTTAGNKKGQAQQPQERPKLTTKEEEVYGITHHDRLGSGPIFRTEKINKLFSHKSNQQQLRINNALNELDVPSRLAMPTSATTAAYESLLGAVNSLLDARKVADKLDGEIKLEQAKKAEREKANAPPETEGEAGEAGEAGEESKDTEEKADVDGADETKEGADAEAEQPAAEDEEKNDEEGEDNEDNEGDEKEGEPSAAEEEAEEETPAEAKPSRAGSVAAHKRSASVLSTVSDKSAKRQKK